MGWWSTFRASIKKSSELKRVAAILGAPVSRNVQQLLENSRLRESALNDLLNIIEADPALAGIMRKHEATRENLKKAYQTMELLGGGWAKGHWVPASAIAFGGTLSYVLAHKDANDQNTWLNVTDRVGRYFANGELGNIK